MTDTIRPVARPRNELNDQQRRRLEKAAEKRDAAAAAYRDEVLAVLAETSFVEVSKATGLSTNTLYRWKAEVTIQ